MSAQPALSLHSGIPQTQGMNAEQMIKNLRELLPDSSLISVAIKPPNSNSLESYTKLVLTNTPNSPPAIFVGNSPLIPPTSVDALIQVYSLPSNASFLNQPVRLLKQSDGFGINVDLKTNQLVISAPTGSSGQIDYSIFNRYGLVSIMNNWTFGTLLFADMGMRQ